MEVTMHNITKIKFNRHILEKGSKCHVVRFDIFNNKGRRLTINLFTEGRIEIEEVEE